MKRHQLLLDLNLMQIATVDFLYIQYFLTGQKKPNDDSDKLNDIVRFYKMTDDEIDKPRSISEILYIGSFISNIKNTYGYITFSISWIHIQFKAIPGSLLVRTKYGRSEWTGWQEIV